MQKIILEEVLEKEYPKLKTKPKWYQNIFTKVLSKLLYINDINFFIEKYGDLRGIDFLDEAFEHLRFTFRVTNKDYTRIPSEGRVICIANHPIGSLDGLALIKTVHEIRKDVKIVANRILSNFENLNNFFFSVNVLYSKSHQRQIVEQVGKALEKEEAVIIFPAGEVSRLRGLTITDSRWSKGALYFAKKYNAPILPMFVAAKNSMFFYLTSTIYKPLSTLLLAHELFNKKGKTINIKIGNPIPAKVFTQKFIKPNTQIKLLRKHVYRVGKNKPEIFLTERNIIHPVDKKLLYKEIYNLMLLGKTKDNKKILLANYEEAPNTIKEIARLRELTFRYVGEGTGKKHDTDKFDKHYKHIILWDDKELEIVGSYRVGVGEEIIKNHGYKGFYSSTLFKFNDNFIKNYLPCSLELGRSFVQKKYWNTNALHYLWLGLGAYLAYNPGIKYMFGPVSISNSLEQYAKELIVLYFKKWFPSQSILAEANNKMNIRQETNNDFLTLFSSTERRKEFKTLKTVLKPLGYTVPVLYKHYSDLCKEGGVQFLDFSIDPDFENCIDGLILVSNSMITEEKKERYITPFMQTLKSA